MADEEMEWFIVVGSDGKVNAKGKKVEFRKALKVLRK